ncbi:plastocyanin [Halobacteriales archaeon QS_1_68_20]|nr:MAG: plastocyanin [Halobacteriales archaeon QS_1_68_20]
MRANSSRREFVSRVGALGVIGALAGCTGGDGDDDENGNSGDGDTVVAGPGGDLVFDPDSITVSVGDTVTWEFDSPNHNVSANPDHADQVEIPDGADPFASYDGDNKFATVSEGETYEHTFETAGTYTYVCIPHAGAGMVGEVVVEE